MSFIREQIKKMLLKRGAILSRPPGQFSITDYKLRAMRDRGLDLKCVIDGGAASGEWTESVKAIYPASTVLMIEPRQDAQEELNRKAAAMQNVRVAQALLGPSDQLATFHESGHQSSLLKSANGGSFGQTKQVEMATLDTLIARLNLPQPDLIKLDLQGYELEALKGANRALQHAQMIFLEVTFVPIYENMPLIADVIPFMTEHGFRVYDIMGLWHRPLDGALVQGDFAFIKQGHPLTRDSRWGLGEQGE